MGGQDPLCGRELEAVRKENQKRIGEQWLSKCSATQPNQARQTINGLWWRLGHCARWVRLRDEDELRRRTRGRRALVTQSARAVTDLKLSGRIGSRAEKGTRLPTGENAVRVVQSTDALYGRVAARLGPVPNFVSTHPCEGLTPERVGGIFETVLVSGWMLDKACLDEDVILARFALPLGR